MIKWQNVIDVHIQVDRRENTDLPFIVIQNQFEKHKDENNELCPLVNRNTRLPGVDYGKYETEFLNVKGD